MGLETSAIIGLAAMGASTVAGVTTAQVQSEGAAMTNAHQIAASKALQEDAQQYNTEMYERQLADTRENYQTQLADSRANYQMQRQDQEKFYNKYLSMSGMSNQLRSVGVNPGSYFGAGKGFNGASAMPAVNPTALQTPSAPSSPLASVGTLQNPAAAYGAIVPQISTAIKDLASAAQSSASARETQTLLEQKLHKLIADTGGQEALNTQIQLENEITKAFGKKKAAAEIKELTQSAFLKSMMGKTEAAKKDLLQIQEKIGSQDLKIKTEEALNIATLLKKQINFVQEQIDTEKARQFDLGASAKEHLSGSALKSQQLETEKFTTQLQEIQANVSEKTKSQRIDTLLSELRFKAEMSHMSEVAAKISRIRKEVLLKSYNGETNVNLKKWDAYVDWIGHIIKSFSPLADDAINSSPSYSSSASESFSHSY